MENNLENALDNFIGITTDVMEVKSKNGANKRVVLDEREGLVERIDKIFVTKEGKQLLREQY